MSVSRSTGDQDPPMEGDSYADTIHVNHRAKQELVFGSGTGVDLDPSGVDNGEWWRSRPADGQFESNTQVAELIAIRRHVAFARPIEVDALGTTPGSFHVEFQIQTGGNPIWGTEEGSWTDYTDQSSPSYGDLNDEYQGVVNESKVWPDHLFESAVAGHTAFNDTSQGTGGGGQSAHHQPSYFNFREVFGQGPLYTDPSDNTALLCQGVINWSQIDNQALECKVVDSTYWDIWQLDEPLESLKLSDI